MREGSDISACKIGADDHMSSVSGACRDTVRVVREKAKPSASGEEPAIIVVPRAQDFLLHTGDTTVGLPTHPQHTTSLLHCRNLCAHMQTESIMWLLLNDRYPSATWYNLVNYQ